MPPNVRVDAAVRGQLENLLAVFRHTLGPDLAGVYLHGSLALGCFNPARSDLDLLVVSTRPLATGERRCLLERLLALSRRPAPVEISFLHRGQLHPWEHPARYDLHFSEHWRDQVTACLGQPAWPADEPAEQRDEDLALHVGMTLARGLALAGLPPEQIFPTVPAEHVRAALASDFNWGRERAEVYPVYFVLNTCRQLAYLAEGRLLSKVEGGTWATRRLPQEFHAVIRAALAEYACPPGPSGLDPAAVRRLSDYAAERIGEGSSGR